MEILKSLKIRKICYLTGKRDNLTYHHIIPQKEVPYHHPENLMVLTRKIHDIIDLKKESRTYYIYRKYKKEIDKYNTYLRNKGFEKRHFWKIYKRKKRNKASKKQTTRLFPGAQKQYKKYIQKRKQKQATPPIKKNNLTPYEKRNLNKSKNNKSVTP